MSRSGYLDDVEPWSLIRWRGAVASALRGQRGQAFLSAMLTSLDALPEPRLIEGELVTPNGCCAMGAVAIRCGVDVTCVDPLDPESVARAFGIPPALAQEVAYINDECAGWMASETPEARFQRVRAWVVEQLVAAPPPKPAAAADAESGDE